LNCAYIHVKYPERLFSAIENPTVQRSQLGVLKQENPTDIMNIELKGMTVPSVTRITVTKAVQEMIDFSAVDLGKTALAGSEDLHKEASSDQRISTYASHYQRLSKSNSVDTNQ
jgi:hypothetical protein